MTQSERSPGPPKNSRRAGGQTREEPARSVSALDQAIGLRLRQIRLAAGMRGEDLAQRIGVTPAQLYRYETGFYRLPAAHLPDVARALKVTIDDLVGDGSPPSEVVAESGREPIARFLREVALIEDGADLALLLKLARRLARGQRESPDAAGAAQVRQRRRCVVS